MIPNTPYFKKELDRKNPSQGPTIGLFKTTHNIAKRYEYKKALEVGIAWAITTIAILSASKKGTLLSVDKSYYPNTERQIRKLGYGKRWRFAERESQELLPELIKMKYRFDLICIDGDHRYKFVKEDMENAMALLDEGGVIIIDDYKHTKNWLDGKGDEYGVNRAVNETIKKYKMNFKLHEEAHGIMELRREKIKESNLCETSKTTS